MDGVSGMHETERFFVIKPEIKDRLENLGVVGIVILRPQRKWAVVDRIHLIHQKTNTEILSSR